MTHRSTIHRRIDRHLTTLLHRDDAVEQVADFHVDVAAGAYVTRPDDDTDPMSDIDNVEDEDENVQMGLFDQIDADIGIDYEQIEAQRPYHMVSIEDDEMDEASPSSSSESSDNSDPDIDTDSDAAEEEFMEKLKSWAIDDGIKLDSISRLLKILIDEGHNLPRDGRTLMKTPRKVTLQSISGGQYYHFGLKVGLISYIERCEDCAHGIELQYNIDGVPVHKSTGHQFWPILCQVVSDKKPFMIGLFEGQQKPSTLEFLQEFVDEYNELAHNGLYHEGMWYTVNTHSFVCDAPARAMVKCVAPHNGYNGCERCQQEGVWQGRMTYPTVGLPRLDNDFATYEGHVKGESPLAEMNVHMVTQFVLDYMHLTLLGVAKKLFTSWRSKGPLRVRMGPLVRQQVDTRLAAIVPSTPSDFARIPRTLDKLKYFKATEYRQLILYTGIFVFRCIDQGIYKHFLLFHVALSILVDDELYIHHQYAKDLLVSFVNQCSQIYGPEFIVYNVHNLLHLPDDVSRFGPLDNISAFPFENFMRRIKKYIRKSGAPLTQLVKRYYEGVFVEPSPKVSQTPVLSKPHERGPLIAQYMNGRQFSKMDLMYTVIRVGAKDGHVQIGTKIAYIRNIVLTADEKIVYCIQCTEKSKTFMIIPYLRERLAFTLHLNYPPEFSQLIIQTLYGSSS